MCSTYTTEESCLSTASALVSGQTECMWEANFDDGFIKCSLRPPPSDFSFVIFVAVVTSIISVPFDLLITLLLLLVCNRKPQWSLLGFPDMRVAFLNRNDAAMFKADEANIAYVLSTLRKIKALMASNSMSENHKDFVIKFMKKLGIHYQNDSQCIHLNTINRLIYSSVAEIIGRYVKDARVRGERILEEVAGIPENAYDSIHLKETILVHHFTYEQVGFVFTKVLQPHLDQYSRRLPLSIHPIAWLAGWSIVIAINMFFIVWVLLWGFRNTGLTFRNWIVNFILETLWGCFISSTLRVFLVHVFLVGMTRPRVIRAVNGLCEIAREHSENEVQEDLTFLQQAISPVSQAAKIITTYDKRISIAKVITCLSDEDLYAINQSRVDNYFDVDDTLKKQKSFRGKEGIIDKGGSAEEQFV